ncbi:MAG: bis-aminopropyl spermidine synthase family protein [Candidatus Absconditabacterales bacterium]
MILTSDSHIEKGFCLKHCLLSVLGQKFKDYEIIIIDNSKTLDSHILIKNVVDDIVKQDGSFVSVHVVRPPAPLSRGSGRTFGGKFCNGDYIIFLDDDAIILSEDAFSKIDRYSQKYDFGYGAKRYWTKPSLRFKENSDIIFDGMIKGEKIFKHHLGFAPRFIRGDIDNTLQNLSFIGHFGFCKKSLFDLIGGYPDFPGCDFEDDYFMYKCFQSCGKFVKLDDIQVVHVTHSLNKVGCSNIVYYLNLLKKEGIFWFHVGKTLRENCTEYAELIEVLHEYHPDYRVIEGYNHYQKIMKKQKKLPRSVTYGIQDYCILLNKLLHNISLNDFVRSSDADFDNMIPVIQSFVESQLIFISKSGKIKDLLCFKTFPDNNIQIDNNIIPKSIFNQFPCDAQSRENRLSLIRERYPLTDHINIALLGDDDLVSILLGNENRIHVDVVEVDTQITKIISDVNLPNIRVFNEDLRKKGKITGISAKTFFIDPPYTKNGILLFIYKGLQLLTFNSHDIQEFYVIMNQSMTKNFIDKIQLILSASGVRIHEVRSGFSNYHLPKSYAEYTRAMKFLDYYTIPQENLTYSSSSSLYIFRTSNPNLDLLWENINIDMIYNHSVF